MQVAKSVEDGIEDLARFLRIERRPAQRRGKGIVGRFEDGVEDDFAAAIDRKSTRLNSRHLGNSYAVFCLKQNGGEDWFHGPQVRLYAEEAELIHEITR